MAGGSSSTRLPSRLEGRRLAREAITALGPRIRAARLRRKWTQAMLGQKVGLTASRIGQIEAGRDTGPGIEVLFSLSVVFDIPLKVEFGRDAEAEPVDAGHLKMQELGLLLGRQTGFGRTFELSTKPANPSYSIDVGLRDDTRRLLIIEECWNTFGNVNASIRSTRRKIAETEAMAVAIGGERGPYKVAGVWIVRDTRANRALIARYPEVFASAFPGSS